MYNFPWRPTRARPAACPRICAAQRSRHQQQRSSSSSKQGAIGARGKNLGLLQKRVQKLRGPSRVKEGGRRWFATWRSQPPNGEASRVKPASLSPSVIVRPLPLAAPQISQHSATLHKKSSCSAAQRLQGGARFEGGARYRPRPVPDLGCIARAQLAHEGTSRHERRPVQADYPRDCGAQWQARREDHTHVGRFDLHRLHHDHCRLRRGYVHRGARVD